MTSSNYVFITSRLGGDPELQYLDNGTALAKFSLPVDIGYGDKKDTEWVRVSVWGKQAESCNANLRKGSLVTVAGTIEKTWVNDKGSATIQVKAINVNFLSDFGKSESKEDNFDF